jgi:hypothetical protein
MRVRHTSCLPGPSSLPATPPEIADSKSPKPPTPTFISSSPNNDEPFTKLVRVSDARSKTRNFVNAKGNSLAKIGRKDDHNGLISSAKIPFGKTAVDDAPDVAIRPCNRFCF